MTPEQLEAMSVTELKALAGERGVPRAAKMRREELVAALATQSRGPHPGTPTPAKGLPTIPPAAAPSSLVAHQSPPAHGAHRAEHGLPIPERYGHDRLVLLVQDPEHVFAYWEVTEERYAQVRTQAGEGATAVLAIRTSSGTEQREIDLRSGNYYLAVAPNGTYQGQLALRDRHGRLHAIATSNQVTTPPATVSVRTDEQWMAVDETFHELLAMAGLPSHAGSSMARLAETRLAAWGWKESPPLSSGALAGAGAHGLSSHSLGSHSLGSHTLARRGDEPRR